MAYLLYINGIPKLDYFVIEFKSKYILDKLCGGAPNVGIEGIVIVVDIVVTPTKCTL